MLLKPLNIISVLCISIFALTGCFKSDIDTVKNGFFNQDRSQNIGKFLETYKPLTQKSWSESKDERSRDLVTFVADYSNNAVANVFLSEVFPDFAGDYADDFAKFLDDNKFKLKYQAQFLILADKNSKEAFEIISMGLSSSQSDVISNEKSLDKSIHAIVTNKDLNPFINEEDYQSLNYLFEKFIAQSLLKDHNKTAQAFKLNFKVEVADIPGILLSSIKDGKDSFIDYYPIERVEIKEVITDDANKTLNVKIQSELTSAYLDALYGKDIGRQGHDSLFLDCNKFDALNLNYEVLASQELMFTKKPKKPKDKEVLLSESLDSGGLWLENGKYLLILNVLKNGMSFSCNTYYKDNKRINAFMRQQERLYKVDNMVKISLLEEILMNAITGKELTEDEFHQEVVKGREKEYKDKKWVLPPSLFQPSVGEAI